MEPTIIILLPVHNRIEKTKLFINCLKEQTYKKYHVVLIDDGSKDNTSNYVEKVIKNLTIIKGTGKWWWGGSLQQGYIWINNNHIHEKDIVLIMNDDTLFKKDFLENIIKNIEPNTMTLARPFSLQTHKEIKVLSNLDFKNLAFHFENENNLINCLPTRGLFMYKNVFEKAGRFKPKMLPHYLSDYEYTYRASRKGIILKISNMVMLEVNEETNAFSKIEERSFFKNLSLLFSNKNTHNPLHWSAFIILSSKFPYNIKLLIKHWKIALVKIIKYKKTL